MADYGLTHKLGSIYIQRHLNAPLTKDKDLVDKVWGYYEQSGSQVEKNDLAALSVRVFTLTLQRLRVVNPVWTLLCVYNQLNNSNCSEGGLLMGGG